MATEHTGAVGSRWQGHDIVNGPIAPEEMGITLMHEHILLDASKNGSRRPVPATARGRCGRWPWTCWVRSR
jgi:hypothetical protein